MIAMELWASPSVFDVSGDRFSVQLMNMARRSEKSQSVVLTSASCPRSVSWRQSPLSASDVQRHRRDGS